MMDPSPILTAPVILKVHLVAAVAGILLGPLAIYRTRRDVIHRIVGRTWVCAMAVLALTGLLIPASVLPIAGPFGPIHLFSLWTLLTLWRGVTAIRRGDVVAHSAEMRSLYLQGICIAGLLTILPGRTLNAVFFADAPWLGAGIALGIGMLAATRILLQTKGFRQR
ncbi:DUF2306 domain-containing protein [Hasllibacter sp. MH4015]|uniref:DUF2306 domain-containing protein n=1 Tax=Hasllibacter sp. MH4015 TaxID=2854029 RepID=UPI001CD62B84|nr:DUF2306 domain-containing protein [Hasllibacter sp. MH4015]